jgi:hypothetical protein
MTTHTNPAISSRTVFSLPYRDHSWASAFASLMVFTFEVGNYSSNIYSFGNSTSSNEESSISIHTLDLIWALARW